MSNVIQIDEKDNVATATSDLHKDEELKIEGGTIELKDDIPYGHKFAVRKIAEEEEVIKYGEVIGTSTEDIETGEHVHVHNVESTRGRGDLELSDP